jgi:hypothetical protein
MPCNVSLRFSPQPKNIEESQCKTATKPPDSAKIEDSYKDEIYEVVEMEATSSAKARYGPAQIPQEGTEETTAQADVENQETYVICA